MARAWKAAIEHALPKSENGIPAGAPAWDPTIDCAYAFPCALVRACACAGAFVNACTRACTPARTCRPARAVGSAAPKTRCASGVSSRLTPPVTRD
eukprot:6205770-Pleurochrysis_carterae.AAC.3